MVTDQILANFKQNAQTLRLRLSVCLVSGQLVSVWFSFTGLDGHMCLLLGSLEASQYRRQLIGDSRVKNS